MRELQSKIKWYHWHHYYPDTVYNQHIVDCRSVKQYQRSPDGAFTECGGEHLIAAHYSFIDPERMKGSVGLVLYVSYMAQYTTMYAANLAIQVQQMTQHCLTLRCLQPTYVGYG